MTVSSSKSSVFNPLKLHSKTRFNTCSRSFCSACSYRPCQESIHYVAPHMTKRRFTISPKDFQNCLNGGAIGCTTFSEPLGSQMKALSLGAFVVGLEGYEKDVAKKMYLVMWKCRGDNVNCLVGKSEMAHFENKLKALGVVSIDGVEVTSVSTPGVAVEGSHAQGATGSIREKCAIQ